MTQSKIVSSATRRKQLLGEQAESLRIIKATARLIESQKRALVDPLFSLDGVSTLLTAVTDFGRYVHELRAIIGDEPEVDDDAKVLALFTSAKGEELGRAAATARDTIEAQVFGFVDGTIAVMQDLENAEPTPLVVRQRSLLQQVQAFGRQVEAQADLLHAMLYLSHLQFWVEDGRLRFDGDEELKAQAAKAEPAAATADTASDEQGDAASETAAIPTDTDEAASGDQPADEPESAQAAPAKSAAKKAAAAAAANDTTEVAAPKRKLSAVQSKLVKSHGRQLRLFKRTAAAFGREFAKVEGAQDALAAVSKAGEMIAVQAAATDKIIMVAQQVEGEGNLTPPFMLEFFRRLSDDSVAYPRPGIYEFENNRRQMIEHVGDMDEWRTLLAASYESTQAAEPFKAQPEVWDPVSRMSWRYAAGQYQVESLARQSQAITHTQLALFRSLGLKFWQGHKRYMRWEGDKRTTY